MHNTLLWKSHELTIFVDSSFRKVCLRGNLCLSVQLQCICHSNRKLGLEGQAKMIIEFPQRLKKRLQIQSIRKLNLKKENLFRIRHKCNLYTYIPTFSKTWLDVVFYKPPRFSPILIDFPKTKLDVGEIWIRKDSFPISSLRSTSTSKTLFYATLKLEPILKGLVCLSPFLLVSAETHCQQIKMQMGGRGKVEKSSICFLVVSCE